MLNIKELHLSDAVFLLPEMSAKMRSLDRENRGLKMEKEDIERVS